MQPLWCDAQSELVNRLKTSHFDQFASKSAVLAVAN